MNDLGLQIVGVLAGAYVVFLVTECLVALRRAAWLLEHAHNTLLRIESDIATFYDEPDDPNDGESVPNVHQLRKVA